MRFFARFSNIHLEIDLSMIYTFLKQIREEYHCKWVKKNEHRVLIVYGEKNYELPFEEKDNKIFLSLEELTTNEKTFALLFNRLLFEARKKKMGIPSVRKKVKRTQKESQQELITMEKPQIEREEKKNLLEMDQQMTEYIIQTEIDYVLMDLHEALQIQDNEKVSWCKKRLEEMVRIRTNNIH